MEKVMKKVKMLRLNDEEVEKVREKAIEINKKLIRLEKEPVKDSELMHVILRLGTENIIVNKDGELEI
jgi:hypothetical protein